MWDHTVKPDQRMSVAWCPTNVTTMLHTKSFYILCMRPGAAFSGTCSQMPRFSFSYQQAESMFYIHRAGSVLQEICTDYFVVNLGVPDPVQDA